MAVGDRRSTGRGANAIEAMAAAAATLAQDLTGSPVSAEEIAWWGAKDAASALRIKRAWRRYDLDISVDAGEWRDLLKTDGDSPWTHALAVHADLFGAEGFAEQKAQALERATKLPPSRALGLKALLSLDDPMEDSKAQLTVMRQAHSASPDDLQLMGWLGFSCVKEAAARMR
jgi:hypothetical protein